MARGPWLGEGAVLTRGLGLGVGGGQSASGSALGLQSFDSQGSLWVLPRGFGPERDVTKNALKKQVIGGSSESLWNRRASRQGWGACVALDVF